MADKSVTVRFSTREEQYASQYPDDSLAGFNERGEPLRARLEIDTDETVGDEPYKLVYNVGQDKWVGQDVFLKYFSNSGDPITVRTTNGVAEFVEENVVSEGKTETITFTNEAEKRLSGIPSAGSVSTEWVGNVLQAGASDGDAASLCSGMKTAGPNVTFDGERLRIPEDATGVLKVTYTETFARIRSNAAEMGTVVVAVCQGRLAEAEQYEVEYTETTWTGNPNSECCRTNAAAALSIPASFTAAPGWDTGVYVSGGCPPLTWEVTGTGLSIKNAVTPHAEFNTLTAAADSCGDGILKVTDDCGDYVEAVIETDVGCCEDQGGDPFAWADGVPDTVCSSPPVGDPIGVTGGVPPYTWQVTIGDDVAFWGNSSTTDPVNVLFNTATDPTTFRVRVNDSCGEILYRDFAVGMKWADDNPTTIGLDDEVAVSVEGGIGPYTWSVSGTGFSMAVPGTEDDTNLLYTDGSACGLATITVTDSCGQSCTGKIKSTVGSFVLYQNMDPSGGLCTGTDCNKYDGTFTYNTDGTWAYGFVSAHSCGVSCDSATSSRGHTLYHSWICGGVDCEPGRPVCIYPGCGFRNARFYEWEC